MNQSDVAALISDLAQCEMVLRVASDADTEQEWESIHSELNRFFSPLEIRRMVWEFER